MVVPFPAGGPTDGIARIISDRLGAVLGQTVVVENRGGGAGGSIGAKAVATADPDGYTILITPGGSLTTGPAVHSNIGYDPVKAFVPVCQVIDTPQVMAVHRDLPVKTPAEVVAYAKANPGKVSWGSQGFGTAPHLLAELFKLETGANIVHVPIADGADARGRRGGRSPDRHRPLTTSCRIPTWRCALAVTCAAQPEIADVPTVAEAGFQAAGTFLAGRGGAASTPPEIINKLNAAFRDSPPRRKHGRLATLGADIKIGTPAEL
jgi:tripartite-type tricarboxylate transporter receptor subunit TctC